MKSEIHGLGVVATKDIPSGVSLGVTHIVDDRFQDGHIRTPLGGFYNHSDYPNCEKHYFGDFVYLKTTREIKAGEEITCRYTFYNLG